MTDIIVTLTHAMPWTRLQDLACNLNYSPPEWFYPIEFTVNGEDYQLFDMADKDTFEQNWKLRVICENPDEEGWLTKILTPEVIRASLMRMSSDGKYRRFIRERVDENDDWETADCIFQYLVYDEIVFG